ncbi:hypothetical protein [Hymenobacter sp. CRA2]|uniref:hypothetical protein n=1 Tax=Hymenobacter sp. CRA2 TaxID=1955620 RepID=UPI0011162C47|nr:hypothetical protein [Hymenobacter sp. CRA2]
MPFINCWLGASGAFEFRPDASLGDFSAPYAAATIFLRTGHGPNRAHLLLGLGRNWALGDNPADTDFAEYTRQDSFIMLGFESDYTHRLRHSNALGVYFNYGITPAIRGYRFSPGGGRITSDNTRHLALTISLSPYWFR